MNRNGLVEAARALQAKLSRYLELSDARSKIDAEIVELERDDALRRALEPMPTSREEESEQDEAAIEGGATLDDLGSTCGMKTAIAAESARSYSVPRSRSGRIQRGYLDSIFPEVAAHRLATDRVYSAREIRDEIAGELSADDIGVNTVQALLDRLVTTGKIEEDGTQRPKMYKIPNLKEAFDT